MKSNCQRAFEDWLIENDNYIKFNGKEEDDFKSDYDDMLDECNDEIHIGSLSFSPSTVLAECDPIAYNIGLGEYVDGRDDLVEVKGYYFTQKDYDEAFDEYDNEEEEEDETAYQLQKIREENIK